MTHALYPHAFVWRVTCTCSITSHVHRLGKRHTEIWMAEQSKESGGAYVHLISGSHLVTVHNWSGLGSSILPTTAGRVIVTPLTSTPSSSTTAQSQLISKVLVKAFTKGNKKDPKIFILRNINPDEVSTVHKL